MRMLVKLRVQNPNDAPIEFNGVFVEMDEATLQRLANEGWFVYRFLDGTVRFMCSWATTPEMVDELGEAIFHQVGHMYGLRHEFDETRYRAYNPLSKIWPTTA